MIESLCKYGLDPIFIDKDRRNSDLEKEDIEQIKISTHTKRPRK